MQGSFFIIHGFFLEWTRNTASFTITLEPPSNCTCISSRMLSNSRCESFAVSTVLMTRNNPFTGELALGFAAAFPRFPVLHYPRFIGEQNTHAHLLLLMEEILPHLR